MKPEMDEQLSDLLDGRLNAEQAQSLRARMKREPALAELFAQLQEQSRLMRELPRINAPHDFCDRVLNQVLAQPVSPNASPRSPVRSTESSSGAERRLARRRWLVLAASLSGVLLIGYSFFPAGPRQIGQVESSSSTGRVSEITEHAAPSAVSPKPEAASGSRSKDAPAAFTDEQAPDPEVALGSLAPPMSGATGEALGDQVGSSESGEPAARRQTVPADSLAKERVPSSDTDRQTDLELRSNVHSDPQMALAPGAAPSAADKLDSNISAIEKDSEPDASAPGMPKAFAPPGSESDLAYRDSKAAEPTREMFDSRDEEGAGLLRSVDEALSQAPRGQSDRSGDPRGGAVDPNWRETIESWNRSFPAETELWVVDLPPDNTLQRSSGGADPQGKNEASGRSLDDRSLQSELFLVTASQPAELSSDLQKLKSLALVLPLSFDERSESKGENKQLEERAPQEPALNEEEFGAKRSRVPPSQEEAPTRTLANPQPLDSARIEYLGMPAEKDLVDLLQQVSALPQTKQRGLPTNPVPKSPNSGGRPIARLSADLSEVRILQQKLKDQAVQQSQLAERDDQQAKSELKKNPSAPLNLPSAGAGGLDGGEPAGSGLPADLGSDAAPRPPRRILILFRPQPGAQSPSNN